MTAIPVIAIPVTGIPVIASPPHRGRLFIRCGYRDPESNPRKAVTP